MKKLLLILSILMPMMVTAQEVSPQDSLAAKEAEKNDLLIAQQVADKEDVVYKVVEQMPEFPGGANALRAFLAENVKYPSIAKENGIYGRVVCQFIVEKDGSITDVRASISSGERSLDNEAIRVIKSMPKWKPGKQQNKPVRTRYTLPISFKLDDDKSSAKKQSKPVSQKTMTTKPEVKQETQEKRKMGSFTDGEVFPVKREKDSKPILAPNGMIISPNLGFINAHVYEHSTITAEIHMREDTMFVLYQDEGKRSFIKRERYLYNAAENSLALEGEQVYLQNFIPYCSEIIVSGFLKRVIWYDAEGKKERIYLFKNNKDITEMQFYPSGKVSIRNEHFGTPQEVRSVYNEDGSDGELVEAMLLDEPEKFDACFNKSFRYNRLFTHEVFALHITVDTVGTCSASVFAKDGTFLTHMDFKDEPLWSPATINGHPVQSSVFRYVTYNPMEYMSSSDTLPMYNMQSSYTTYSGIRWIDTRLYSFVSTDTCSFVGTVEEHGDTTVLCCFDKKSRELIARQSYMENDFGKKIKEGWFTYYKNSKKCYAEQFVNDTVSRTIHYDANEVPKMEMVRLKNRKGAAWDTVWHYYPDGRLKMMSIPVKNEDKDDICIYYDKQGNPTTEFVQPLYPGKEKALNKYLRKNVRITDSKLWKQKSWTSLECWADFFVEVDANGKVLQVGKGASSCTQNYRGAPLDRREIELLYDLLKESIENNPTLWEPGTIQNESTSMFTKVRVKYSYSR